MATYYERGDGQWEVDIRRVGFPRQRRTWSTKAKAEQWARKVEGDMDAGTFRRTDEARRLLMSALIRRYKAEIAPKLADVAEKCRIADVIDKRFGKFAVLNLEAQEITKWRDYLSRSGKGNDTVNKHVNTLSAIFTAAMKEFHIPIPMNPAKLVTRLKRPPPRTQRVKDEVIEWLVAANRESNEKARHYGVEPRGEFEAWLRLALESAMRRGEIERLDWPNIDMKAQTGYLPKTKNGEPRTVPLSKKAIAVLLTMRARNPKSKGRVFSINRFGFQSAYRRAKAAVVRTHPEVKNVRFHDTRREATNRLAKKLNIVELGATTGHKRLDTLKVYYQPDPVELAQKIG
jgi:integrase